MPIRPDLVALRTKANEAKQRFENLGLCNTYNLTAEQQVKLDLDYAHARRAWNEAEKLYTAALDELTMFPQESH